MCEFALCERLLYRGPSRPLQRLADVDQDGNGVDDAISIGLRMSLVGATLTDPPFPSDG